MEHVLFYLLVGTRGGTNRIRLLRSLIDQPKNANQLADELELDYKTIRHHLDLLEEHGVVEATGGQYAKVYFTTDSFEAHRSTFEQILTQATDNAPGDNHEMN